MPEGKLLSAESVQLTYSLYVVLANEYFESCDLFRRLRWTTVHSPDARTSHLRTLSKISGTGLSACPFPQTPQCPSEPHIIQGF